MKRKSISFIALLTALLLAFSAFGISAGAASEDIAQTGAKPVFKEAAPVAGGMRISWEAMSGIPAYRVFRWYDDGRGWVALKDTRELSYTDANVSAGISYRYRLAGISVSGTVITDTAVISCTYKEIPRINSAQITADGIRLSWSLPADVSRVAVYRRENGWKRIATTYDRTYIDKDMGSGGEYTYTVRALNDNGSFKSDDFDTVGYTVTRLSTPSITAYTAADGVKISWKPVTGAELYRVYVKKDGGWTSVGNTAEAEFTDTNVVSGCSYTYTVRCISADLSEYTSYFDIYGKTVLYIEPPALEYAEGTNSGVKIVWRASPGAYQYRVFRKNAGAWDRLGVTSSTSFIDSTAAQGGRYTYTVRCLDNDGGYCSYYDSEGVSCDYLATPSVISVENTADGVRITWDKIDRAEQYRLFVYDEKGWKKLADLADTSYTDSDVVSGNTYRYTVRCVNADGTLFTSGHTSGKSVYYVAAPTIKSASNISGGVEITWDAVEGAGQYRVYYYGAKGWTALGNTKETSFIDMTAVSGASRIYTVRCLNAAGTAFVSSFRDGVKNFFVDTPAVSVASGAASIQVSWSAPQGAERYRVYLKTPEGWKKLAELTGNTYEDKNVVSGRTYTYTVRCLNKEATEFTSDFNREGVSCTFVAVPVLSEPSLEMGGVRVSWSACEGAGLYRVYYKSYNSWVKLATTDKTTYKDTSILSGTTRVYTVRCLSADGKAFVSDFDRNGKSIYYVDAPELASYSATAKRITINWTTPYGSSLYRVYKKVNGLWKRQTDTYDDSYTDTNVVAGGIYTYTVRCMSDDGKRYESWFDEKGITVTAVTSQADFKYYDQGDYDYPYGDDTIAYSGCGPTCFAMIASTLTGRSIDPIDAVDWCGNDYYIDHVGTRWDYFEAASDHFGISCTAQYDDYEFDSKVMNALRNGKLVISAQSAGLFTRSGHFIVLAGLDSKGNIIVYDPNGWNGYIGSSVKPENVSVSGTQYWVFEE